MPRRANAKAGAAAADTAPVPLNENLTLNSAKRARLVSSSSTVKTRTCSFEPAESEIAPSDTTPYWHLPFDHAQWTPEYTLAEAREHRDLLGQYKPINNRHLEWICQPRACAYFKVNDKELSTLRRCQEVPHLKKNAKGPMKLYLLADVVNLGNTKARSKAEKKYKSCNTAMQKLEKKCQALGFNLHHVLNTPLGKATRREILGPGDVYASLWYTQSSQLIGVNALNTLLPPMYRRQSLVASFSCIATPRPKTPKAMFALLGQTMARRDLLRRVMIPPVVLRIESFLSYSWLNAEYQVRFDEVAYFALAFSGFGVAEELFVFADSQDAKRAIIALLEDHPAVARLGGTSVLAKYSHFVDRISKFVVNFRVHDFKRHVLKITLDLLATNDETAFFEELVQMGIWATRAKRSPFEILKDNIRQAIIERYHEGRAFVFESEEEFD